MDGWKDGMGGCQMDYFVSGGFRTNAVDLRYLSFEFFWHVLRLVVSFSAFFQFSNKF